jgi:cytosine/uracil/thiamine/allantoin permease
MTNMLAAVRNLKWAASGTDGSHGKADFLENDDIRPLKLQDRTWGQVTYFTFWFSAMATGKFSYGGRPLITIRMKY